MKNQKLIYFISLIFLVLYHLSWESLLLACTTMVFGKESKLLAQNYDFYYGHGEVIYQPKGISKTGLNEAIHKKIRWTSKYATITFNQFARELPTSGMNEKGLSISLLWNLDGKYPLSDPTKEYTISELQWIQYQLDNYDSTELVIQNLNRLKIAKAHADLHYSICDAKRDCRILEFLDGKPVVHPEREIPIFALTNNSYENSIQYYQKLNLGDSKNLPKDKESLAAFSRAAFFVQNEIRDYQDLESNQYESVFEYLKKASLDYTFGDMWNWLVRGQPPSVTVWSVVFDPSQKTIAYRTKDNPKTRIISFSEFTNSCKEGALSMDMEKGEGMVRKHFSPYREEANRRIVELSFAPLEKEFPRTEWHELIRYPNGFGCK
ncbi:MAG: linear amide C-N hydrolase [Leptospira sp.]|nr:linear amide C-N hydrolase [Leptospira sp.]